MRILSISAIAASLFLGCMAHGIPEPLQVPYVWNDSIEPVQPLRADAIKAAGTVVKHRWRYGHRPPSCQYSEEANEVEIFETEQTFDVMLVDRPGWCNPFNTDPLPPMVGEMALEYAVRRSDLRLLRERRRSDQYLFNGKLYKANEWTDEDKEAEKQHSLLVDKWIERFATLSPQAQKAFHERRIVAGMSHEELKLLAEYEEAAHSWAELRLIGVREEIGQPKRELWRMCSPNCGKQLFGQHIIVENGVVTEVQTGQVDPDVWGFIP